MEDDRGGKPEETLIVIHVSEKEVQLSHKDELRTIDAVILISFNKLSIEGFGGLSSEGSEQIDSKVFETNKSENSVNETEETVEDLSFLASFSAVEEVVVNEGKAEGDD